MLEKLEMSHDTFNLTKNGKVVSKTFTILSAQQFYYQEVAWWDSLARQKILFCDLHHKHDIAEKFKELIGIPIDIFLDILQLFLLAVFHKDFTNNTQLNLNLNTSLAFIEDLYGNKIRSKVEDILTVSRESIFDILNEDKRLVRNYNLQVFESSFFARKPFLLFQGKIHLPHKAIMNNTINHYIYEFMKHKDPDFSTELGSRFEKYVQIGLNEINIEYKTENDLRKTLGKKHNVVDFIIEDEILVEVKAIELKPYASLNPTNEILGNELRKTIVKAYSNQILKVANAIHQPNKEYFGIIITYKNLYLGNSLSMWQQFLEEETNNQGLNPQTVSLVPIENLFFMDLRTWDKIIQIIKDKGISLKDILIKARNTDTSPENSKFFFDMHLDEYDIGINNLSYLLKARDEIFSTIK
ncbi:hypothetical protein [Echinicola shivajiensis]|uniref:hypothetical protein n=1 Tax=Echinicola shivajiensis TaxID=1035916 RepID=UPI001BFC8BD6|nr:hypothetical protein [Echinicola shivajiensis]